MLDIFSGTSDYLLGQGIQLAVIFAVVWVVCFLLRRKSAHLRYLLWLLVIAKCIFPSVMKVSLAVLPEKAQAVAIAEVIEQAPPAAASGVAVEFENVVYDEEVFAAASFFDRLEDISAMNWVGIAWGCGVVLFFGVVCFKAWRLNRKLRLMRRAADIGCNDTIKVWQIDGIGQPFVWGLLRGSVYLPGNFDKCGSVEDRRGILMHEFAHVRRFDAGVNVLQIIAQGIFWFHPLVWMANRKIRQEREKCCDEAAIAGLETGPRDYGKAIIDTLTREYESNIPMPSLAVAGPVKNIEDRIKTIMRPDKKFYSRCGIFATITIILLAVIALPTGCVLTRRGETVESQQKVSEAEVDLRHGTPGAFMVRSRRPVDTPWGVDDNSEQIQMFSAVKPSAVKGKPVKEQNTQVSIKSWFIEAGPDFLEEIGIDVTIHVGDKIPHPKPLLDNEASIINPASSECADKILFDSSRRDFILSAISRHPQAKTLAMPKVTVLDTETAVISTQSEIKYISGYEEDPNNPGEFNKITETLEDGMELELMPNILDDSSNIDLRFNFELNQLVRLTDAIHESGKIFQLPEHVSTKSASRIIIPNGKTYLLVIAGLPNLENEKLDGSTELSGWDRCMIILMSPEIIDPTKENNSEQAEIE